MTATAPAPQPTPEQLKAYAEQLPDLYKDILAAIQAAQPNRVIGQGVLAGTVRMFLLNQRNEFVHGFPLRSISDPRFADPKFLLAARFLTEADFSAIVDRLVEADILEPDDEPAFPRLLPTPLGERLIAAITKKETPRRVLPDLPKPTW